MLVCLHLFDLDHVFVCVVTGLSTQCGPQQVQWPQTKTCQLM